MNAIYNMDFEDEFTVLHVIADLRPQSGGTSRVVVDLGDAIQRHNVVRTVLVSQRMQGDPVLPSLNSDVERNVPEASRRFALRLGLPLRSALRKVIESGRICLIHNHGLWLPVNYWASSISRQNGISLIMQPHGMLEPWAMQHKVWKKRIALALFQRHDLETAKVLVATSAEEKDNIRRLGLRQPIAIIPNGVEVDKPEDRSDLPTVRADYSRSVLFLSRVHPKKGLENLIQAWSQIAPVGWRLLIAGPDEAGHLQIILSMVRSLGLEKSVEYVGPVEGDQKAALYRHADLFVLPTFSENFGVVVAEALAHGLPVITTRGAPWADLETYRCGWWIDIGAHPLIQALREAMALSDDQRCAMGRRGRDYVKRYDWESISRQTIDMYQWVLGNGLKPGCIFLD